MRGQLALVIPFIACTVFATDPTKEVVAAGLGAKLDNYMRRLEAFDYSGSVLVQYKGEIILNKGYGYANREKELRNSPRTVFDVGSFAKQFTATEILLLERAGKLSVKDPISKYLTDVPDRFASVTIENLLTHTGGIPSVVGFKEELTQPEVLKRIFGREPKFPAGEKFEYSNEGYILLASIVQAVSGKRYQDAIRESLFEKSAMRSSGFWGKDAPRVKPDLFSLGYDESGVTFDIRKAKEDNWADMGGGQITSTIEDLYRWHRTIFTSDFLTSDEKARMFKPAKPLDKPVPAWFSSEYGYGWFVQTLPDGKKRIQHGGDSFGFGCQMAWYPAEELLVISLCNTRHDVFPDHIRADRVLTQIIFNEQHDEPPAITKNPTDALRKLIGNYRLDNGDQLVIYDRGDRIMIGSDGQRATELLDQVPADRLKAMEDQEATSKIATSKFFAKDYEWLATKVDAGKPFVDGVLDEITKYGNKFGKPIGARSLGTYQGGFLDYASVWELEFEHGRLPYRIAWTPDAIAATLDSSPPYAAPTPLAMGADGEVKGWNLYTKRGFSIKVRGGELSISGPNATGVARRIP